MTTGSGIVGIPLNTPSSAPVAPPNPANDNALRRAATEMGLDYDSLDGEEVGFIEAYIEAQAADRDTPTNYPTDPRAATDPSVPGMVFDPANPLVPLSPEDAQPSGVSTPDAPESGASAPGSGSADGASDGGGGDGTTPVPPAAAQPAVDPATGLPVGFTPPDLPTFGQQPETATQPLPAPPGAVVDIAGQQLPVEYVQGALATAQAITPQEIEILNAMRQGLVQPVMVDPATHQPIMGQPPTPAPAQPQPSPSPLYQDPTSGEWLDPMAQQAYAVLDQRLTSIDQQTRAVQERILNEQRDAYVSAIDAGVTQFAESTGLDQNSINELVDVVLTTGLLPGAQQAYNGDTRAATQAALSTAFWMTPKYRDAAIQQRIAQETHANIDVERKKAAQQGIVGGGGSVPRTPAAPRNQAERDAGFLAAIEGAMNGSGVPDL